MLTKKSIARVVRVHVAERPSKMVSGKMRDRVRQ